MSSRSDIQGLELRARVDLGLPSAGHVIVMSQVVRRALVEQVDGLCRQAVDTLQLSVQVLPENVRWRGPDECFWRSSCWST